MRIKFLSGPRAGEVSHAPHSQATQLLIDSGIIEVVPYKSFVEFMTAEHASASGPGNVNPPSVVGVVWEFGFSISKKPLILRKQGTEVARFEALTFWSNGKEYEIPQLKDCPALIKKQFAEYANPGAGRDWDAINREQAEQDSASKHGTNRFFRVLGINTEVVE